MLTTWALLTSKDWFSPCKKKQEKTQSYQIDFKRRGLSTGY